jgi:hypothetical protein
MKSDQEIKKYVLEQLKKIQIWSFSF